MDNFAVVDALVSDAGIQSTVTPDHPIKGPKMINTLRSLYANHELPIVFVVPDTIALTFEKQRILTVDGKTPTTSSRVAQYVAGLPVGVDPSELGNDVSTSLGKRVRDKKEN